MEQNINFESQNRETMEVERRAIKKLFYYTERGMSALMRLNSSETALLSKTGQKGIQSARLAYLNLINELKKIETLNLVNSSALKNRTEINQSVDIGIFLRGLCRRITAVVGKLADLKVRFTSDIPKGIKTMCDAALFQFVILNIIATVATNTDKEKKVINVALIQNDSTVQIKIWNKYAFRLKKKVISETDVLEMYRSNYDFEQMVNISRTIIETMKGGAEYIIEDNILKMSVSLSVCEDETMTEVYEFVQDQISETQIILPFAKVLIETTDNSEVDCDNIDILKLFNELVDK